MRRLKHGATGKRKPRTSQQEQGHFILLIFLPHTKKAKYPAIIAGANDYCACKSIKTAACFLSSRFKALQYQVVA
ncbi:MAG: hypothetical protein K0S08_1136 [Gammaproteobacteria bacterium]|nr:hypothetical protein [Gammaproteobacteria bacterium]